MTNIPNVDDIILKARDAAKKASQKTEELVEAGKHKINILTLNAELRKKFEQMGEYCYECARCSEEPGEALEKYISEIDDIKAQIKAAEDALNENGKKIACSACGESNPAGTEYCKNCGNKL